MLCSKRKFIKNTFIASFAVLSPSLLAQCFLKFGTYKLFSLKYPSTLTASEVQTLKPQFWNLQLLKELEDEFISQNKIVFSKHLFTERSESSLIGFSSEQSYCEWESRISRLKACNDDLLSQLEFKIETQHIV